MRMDTNVLKYIFLVQYGLGLEFKGLWCLVGGSFLLFSDVFFGFHLQKKALSRRSPIPRGSPDQDLKG